MLMYNPLEYSYGYSMIPGSLWDFHCDELNDDVDENNAAKNHRINNNKTPKSRSFEYMTKTVVSAQMIITHWTQALLFL